MIEQTTSGPGNYKFEGDERILTPALVIYPELVAENIRATLRMAGGDANRWRPHVKTAKLAAAIRLMIAHGVRCFKCATTLELLTACAAGADDVLLAFPVTGANAQRTIEIASEFPMTRVSVLVETRAQAEAWARSGIGVFIDVNPGMDRTGIGQERTEEILELARLADAEFRGLHYYDGHISAAGVAKDGTTAQAGYDRLLGIVAAMTAAGCAPEEVITSGTPAAPHALRHAGLSAGPFVHRISPGTVVYNDMSSLEQLPGMGYAPAALVVTTVVSHPAANVFTCDAGHKAVSADAGVPTCRVLGHAEFRPLKPSEEHLPVEVPAGVALPEIGSRLYLLPRHVCPTVNNFDEALFVAGGGIRGVERVTARGHEGPLRGKQSFA